MRSMPVSTASSIGCGRCRAGPGEYERRYRQSRFTCRRYARPGADRRVVARPTDGSGRSGRNPSRRLDARGGSVAQTSAQPAQLTERGPDKVG